MVGLTYVIKYCVLCK